MNAESFVATTALLLSSASATSIASDPKTFTYDALGRLIEQSTSRSNGDTEVHSICYDESGNRTTYRTSEDGSSAGCDIGTPTAMASAPANQGSSPPPETNSAPPPPPSNSGPSTAADYDLGACNTLGIVNLTANDVDPDNPLTLTAISAGSGPASASVFSASSVSVDYGDQAGVTQFTYTVADSLGATSTGILDVDTTCSGGPSGGSEEL